MALCSVEGCQKRSSSRGMCPGHYDRARREGRFETPTALVCEECGCSFTPNRFDAKLCKPCRNVRAVKSEAAGMDPAEEAKVLARARDAYLDDGLSIEDMEERFGSVMDKLQRSLTEEDKRKRHDAFAWRKAPSRREWNCGYDDVA